MYSLADMEGLMWMLPVIMRLMKKTLWGQGSYFCFCGTRRAAAVEVTVYVVGLS